MSALVGAGKFLEELMKAVERRWSHAVNGGSVFGIGMRYVKIMSIQWRALRSFEPSFPTITRKQTPATAW